MWPGPRGAAPLVGAEPEGSPTCGEDPGGAARPVGAEPEGWEALGTVGDSGIEALPIGYGLTNAAAAGLAVRAKAV